MLPVDFPVAVNWGISGQYVTRLLVQATLFRSYPLAVRTDSGLEFTNLALIGRANALGIRHILIQAHRPMQTGHIENLDGKFKDECRNEQVV